MEFASKLVEVTGKPYLSYSAIKYAANGSKQQDMKLFELYIKGLLRKESQAFTFGSLYDCLLLEPEKATDGFMILDDEEMCSKIGGKSPRSTKKYKEWKEEFTLEHKSKTLVSEEDWEIATSMINRLDASEVLNPDTGEIVSVRSFLTGKPQVEFNTWIEDIPVRGFFDCEGDTFITDSKSTRSVYGFRYDVKSFDYDIQAYIYTMVSGKKDFYWVAQGKSKPYLCAVYKASDKILASGEYKFRSAVDNISRWLNEPSKDTLSFALYGII
tara:strand:+ start:2914 stop:3723 length:810 start_codon:yes stop_codon:yes gene_type:complete